METREEVLRAAASLFRTYADLHQAKGTPEGAEKAQRNADMADRIESVLASEVPGLPVAGYKPTQSPEAIALVNGFKADEERILRKLDDLKIDRDVLVDINWLYEGRRMIEVGFMLINRSVFQPGRVSLPEDSELCEHCEVSSEQQPQRPYDDFGPRVEGELAEPPGPVIVQLLRTSDSPTVVATWSDGYENSIDLRNYPNETEETIKSRLQNLRAKGHP